MATPIRLPIRGADTAGDAVRQTIRAFHGSPYDFDRFDASKIGTGEGNQSFGHGLYFAGNENVSRQYRDSLSGHQILIDGNPMPTGMGDWARDWAGRLASGRDVSKEVASLRRSLEAAQTERAVLQRIADELGPEAAYEKVGLMSALAAEKYRAQNLEDRLRAYEALSGKDIRYNQGHMYEVEIGHPEEALLDLDSPLDQQPHILPFAEKAIGKIPDTGLRHDAMGLVEDPEISKGKDVYGILEAYAPPGGGAAFASLALLDAGVPGLRYLDAGSRRAGQGTRNYVMFPGTEDQIRILRKYGLLAPMAAAGTMGEE